MQQTRTSVKERAEFLVHTREQLVSDTSAAAGDCRRSSADHRSVQIRHSEHERVQAADVLSQSVHEHHSDTECNTDAEDPNCENYGEGAEIAEEVECGSPQTLH
ncbi:hypothetical protein MTO96_026844 [Rhipicephalus appendiculatus]